MVELGGWLDLMILEVFSYLNDSTRLISGYNTDTTTPSDVIIISSASGELLFGIVLI